MVVHKTTRAPSLSKFLLLSISSPFPKDNFLQTTSERLMAILTIGSRCLPFFSDVLRKIMSAGTLWFWEEKKGHYCAASPARVCSAFPRAARAQRGFLCQPAARDSAGFESSTRFPAEFQVRDNNWCQLPLTRPKG